MKIFPHILARIGGNSFDILEDLDSPSLFHASSAITSLRQDKEQHKIKLCARLLEFNQRQDDTKIQNILQNLRRDLYNNRTIKPGLLSSSLALIPGELYQELAGYLELSRRIDEREEKFIQEYNAEVARARRSLQQLVSDNNLQNGLLLSSVSLFENLNSFQKRDACAFRNKEIQNELTLLKYITRMVTKTSPFSTFNNLSVGKIAKQPGSPLILQSELQEEKVISHISLNNYLYQYLRGLFAASREVYLQLNLRANPTIQDEKQRFVFLTNANNVEAFQRIPVNPVLSLLLQILKERPEGIHFNALLQEIVESIDADTEAIEAFIKQLIDYGFLEYDFGVSGIDPHWDKKLIEKLRPLATKGIPHIEELIDCLAKIRQIANQYAGSDARVRQHLLKEAFSMFRDVCMKLHEEAGLPANERKTLDQLAAEHATRRKAVLATPVGKGKEVLVKEHPRVAYDAEEAKEPAPETFRHRSNTFFNFKPEQIFYEDTTRGVTPVFDREQLDHFVQTLDAFLGELRLFNGKLDDKEKICDFLKRKNESGSENEIGLLAFYEEYQRDARQKETQAATRKKEGGVSPAVNDNVMPDLPEATIRRQEIIKQWHAYYAKSIDENALNQNGFVHLCHEALKQVNKELNLEHAHSSTPNSYGAFIQFLTEVDQNGRPMLKGVINGTFGGHGKMISRFLHILPNEVLDDVRKWNLLLAEPDSLFAEDCDASYFNANLHPPLLPFEIRMPGGHNSLPVEQQLPIGDFNVKYLPEKNEAVLIHKPSGKRAFVLDLGFEGHGRRSQLFKLLLKFSDVDYLFSSPVLHATNMRWNSSQHNMPQKQVKISPRITYEDVIILQRKTWYVPKEFLPVRKTNQDDASYYVYLQEWRRKHGIDKEVFVYLNPTKNNQGVDPKLMQKLGRDDYKPQYINFCSVLMIKLFEKAVGKVPVMMKIEEALPAPNHMTEIAGKRYVTEYLVQWYNYDKD